MPNFEDLSIKLFADCADLETIARLSQHPFIQGITTNPTLMRRANVADYQAFAADVLKTVSGRPVSFEVISDDFAEMEQQGLEMATWGSNVYVKIPVTNTHGEFSGPLIRQLSEAGVQVNVTALMTTDQVKKVLAYLSKETRSFVSVFAGRVADTGRDPAPVMTRAVELLRSHSLAELIWSSPREVLNIFQADLIGCHIITATSDILDKLSNIDKDLSVFSLETVQMFYEDALQAGYTIKLSNDLIQER